MPRRIRLLPTAALTGAVKSVWNRVRAFASESSQELRVARSPKGLISDFHQKVVTRIRLLPNASLTGAMTSVRNRVRTYAFDISPAKGWS